MRIKKNQKDIFGVTTTQMYREWSNIMKISSESEGSHMTAYHRWLKQT